MCYYDEYGMTVGPDGAPVGEYCGEPIRPDQNGLVQNSINIYNYPNKNDYQGPKENFYFNLDPILMSNLGFSYDEITLLENAVSYYGVLTRAKFSVQPFFVDSQIEISRLMYAYQICIGKTVVDTGDIRSLAKHFKKLNTIMCGTAVIECNHIIEKQISKVPRIAVVGGLPTGTFDVLNSKQYGIVEGSYDVVGIAKEWVTIYSGRRMALTKEDRMNPESDVKEYGIPGKLKVKQIGNKDEGKPWILQIHKKYCRLCNRFIIFATTRYSESQEHHGGYNMVLWNGQILSVFARTIDRDSYGNPKENMPSSTKDNAIIGYGFYASQIKQKLESAVKDIQNRYDTVYTEEMGNEQPFKQVIDYEPPKTYSTSMEEEDEGNPDSEVAISI